MAKAIKRKLLQNWIQPHQARAAADTCGVISCKCRSFSLQYHCKRFFPQHIHSKNHQVSIRECKRGPSLCHLAFASLDHQRAINAGIIGAGQDSIARCATTNLTILSIFFFFREFADVFYLERVLERSGQEVRVSAVTRWNCSAAIFRKKRNDFFCTCRDESSGLCSEVLFLLRA